MTLKDVPRIRNECKQVSARGASGGDRVFGSGADVTEQTGPGAGTDNAPTFLPTSRQAVTLIKLRRALPRARSLLELFLSRLS